MGMPVDQWGLQIRPYWFLRTISGIMIVLGQCIFAYYIYKTLFTKPSGADVKAKAAREVKV